MKAAIRKQYGGVKNIRIEDLPKPVTKPKEVLIKVFATTVNRTDEGILFGKPFVYRFFVGLPNPRHIVLGCDFAGRVEAVGEQVSKFKVGDRVFGFNDNSSGSQAEYMTFPADKGIAIIPENIDFETAAASIEGAHYSINFMNKVKLMPGQKAIVNGATGGIGSALLQFLIAEGLEVTAVCNTKNVDLITGLGPNKVYDYLREDFTKDPERYDYVFDAVGKSRFTHCKHLLKEEGAYISSELGKGAENLYLPFTTKFAKKKVKFPMPNDISASLKYIVKHLEQGTFKPVIEKTYPLEEVHAAYKHMLTGEKTGSLVLKF